MNTRLRATAEQLSSSRGLVGAMLLGPLFGAMLAFGAVAASEMTEIKIADLAFSPLELTIPVGATVTWVNKDDLPHSVVDKGKAFRSKVFETNGSFSFTFANAGTYDYICGLHPQMTGKIIVK